MRESEFLAKWFAYNLAILWAVVLIAFMSAALVDRDGEAFTETLIWTVFLGIPFAVGFTLGGVVYLAVLFRFRRSWSRIRRRLLALAVSAR